MDNSDSASKKSRSPKRIFTNIQVKANQTETKVQIVYQVTCLYIGNIDKRISESQLQDALKPFGTLQYCYIIYEPHSISSKYGKDEPKQSRGYGFAKFKLAEEATRAKEKLNNSLLGSRNVMVQFSKRTKPRQPTPGRYLGKKNSPPRNSGRRSRSRSRSSSRSHKKHRRYHEKHRKYNRDSRSPSGQYRRSSYRRHKSRSNSPRR